MLGTTRTHFISGNNNMSTLHIQIISIDIEPVLQKLKAYEF